METIRRMMIGGVFRIVLVAAVGLAGVGWAESSDGGWQLKRWSDELSEDCDGRCSAATVDPRAPKGSDLSFFAYPGCLVSKLLGACSLQDRGAPIGIAVFVIILAVLTRQAIIGYGEAKRLSFALFLIVFFAAVTGYFTIKAISEFMGPQSLNFGFVVLVFASVFFAGLLSFWTKYMLDLFAVALLALIFVGLLSLDEVKNFMNSQWQDLLGVVTGIAGGVWLYWWRDIRKNRKTQQPADDGKVPNTASGTASGEVKSSAVKGDSTQAFRLPRWWPRRS